jgi:uncharacterized protein YaaN involved in tellurite resistance
MDTTDIEKKSLEAHVELCAERYNALETRIDSMIVCIDEIKSDIREMHVMIQTMTEKRNTQLINWGVGIIATLSGVVAWLVTTYVIK